MRPELADFAQHIALWRDRYQPPTDQQDDSLGTHPYLGSAHEYTVDFTVLPDGDHFIADEVYGDPKLQQWLVSQSRLASVAV